MGNANLCYCHQRNEIIEDKNIIKVNEIESTHQTTKKEKFQKKNKKQNLGRTTSFIKGNKSNSKTTEERTSINSPQSKIFENKSLSPNSKNTNTSLNNVVRKKVKSHTLERRSVFLNRTYINILLIGDHKVGKSSFGSKISKDKFKDNHIESKNDENYLSRVNLNNRLYNISFHIPLFENLKEMFQNQIDYYILMYEINNQDSFNFIKEIYENNLKNKMKNNHELSNIIFIGNKKDLGNNNENIINYCNDNQISHFEISVKNNYGLNELCQKITFDFDVNEFEINK